MKIEKKTGNKKKWVKPAINAIEVRNLGDSGGDGASQSSIPG